ncbi:uncharacterized protein SPSK_09960 [Sporothrix schenckii 1099-18]|uniref:Uncharacterized protein n=1 Tax=Sporothrix schenckii 1099-18 TaxID=1397361 RepID=A0A0F2M4G4_SPOSC|nr:uncharacterized protein SPSK_09960 [Sporothrix schenckii 1099-18]KJR84603.1 hypothetical protein SPSK_09960 [Sporothrix schenckii 1099-18]
MGMKMSDTGCKKRGDKGDLCEFSSSVADAQPHSIVCFDEENHTDDPPQKRFGRVSLSAGPHKASPAFLVPFGPPPCTEGDKKFENEDRSFFPKLSDWQTFDRLDKGLESCVVHRHASIAVESSPGRRQVTHPYMIGRNDPNEESSFGQ